MAKIPNQVKDKMIIPSLRNHLIRQGKVRDTYQVPIEANALISVATDRISIFDFVLPAVVPRKGEVLTALTYFWFTTLLSDLPSHLRKSISGNRNHAYELKEFYPDLPLERSLIINRLEMVPYEIILRAHLGGSVWQSYEKTGIVLGLEMPVGLTKWEKLDEPLFTPSTKSDDGHDVNISQFEYFQKTGELGRQAYTLPLRAFKRAYHFALDRGIIILDTKFEVGLDEANQYYLADEVLTPDSSRFTTVKDLTLAVQEKRDPEFYDKEPVRQWGKKIETPFHDEGGNIIIGLNNLDPTNEDHLLFVSNLDVPTEVVDQTTIRYLDIFQMLTGQELDTYQKQRLL